jgi:zinc D-Ala-D-Ala carboxypeptidase
VIGKTESIHPILLDTLGQLEEHMGFELTITSGKRDVEHNATVGGVEDSEHTYELAEGVDVLCRQSITRYKMVKWLLQQNIRRIGIGNSFIHIGIAEDKPQFVLWDYYPNSEA